MEEDTALDPQTPKRAPLLDGARCEKTLYGFRTEEASVHWTMLLIFFRPSFGAGAERAR